MKGKDKNENQRKAARRRDFGKVIEKRRRGLRILSLFGFRCGVSIRLLGIVSLPRNLTISIVQCDSEWQCDACRSQTRTCMRLLGFSRL